MRILLVVVGSDRSSPEIHLWVTNFPKTFPGTRTKGHWAKNITGLVIIQFPIMPSTSHLVTRLHLPSELAWIITKRFRYHPSMYCRWRMISSSCTQLRCPATKVIQFRTYIPTSRMSLFQPMSPLATIPCQIPRDSMSRLNNILSTSGTSPA